MTADEVSTAGEAHHLARMTLDLTDEEAAALVRHLRQALEYDPYPLAPRLDPLNWFWRSSIRRSLSRNRCRH